MAINYTQSPFIMSTYGYGTPYYIRNNSSDIDRIRSRFVFAQTNMEYGEEDFTGQYGFRLILLGGWTGGSISITFEDTTISQTFTDDEFTSCNALRTQFLGIEGVTFVNPVSEFNPATSLLKYWACDASISLPWFTIDISASIGTLSQNNTSKGLFVDNNTPEFSIYPLYPGRSFGGDWYDVISYIEYNDIDLNKYSKRLNYCYQEAPPM